MKNKKFRLEGLEVQSFITSIDKKDNKTINGGVQRPDEGDFRPTGPTEFWGCQSEDGRCFCTIGGKEGCHVM